MNVYESCPVFENETYLLRLVEDRDVDDLLKVYSDEKAVPFFNGDNCHGDDFHYTTRERMQQAVAFWKEAYQNGWFVRWVIVDKRTGEAIGTIENFHRDADDFFANCALLRLDLRSDYETADEIVSILSPALVPSFQIFGCDKIASKAIPAATERRKAFERLGFTASPHKLVGSDGTQYGDYFVLFK
ncbi:MAG: GNAT family N-acetyltransferase [Clostridia bacterium]|nr:GNAT family N-acetyltransferase [Clostridia bacterium]